MDEAIREFVASGKPFLGICVGMQLLFDEGQEFGPHSGLGLLSGKVIKIPDVGLGGKRHKIPNIGWREIILRTKNAPATTQFSTRLKHRYTSILFILIQQFRRKTETVLRTAITTDTEFAQQ